MHALPSIERKRATELKTLVISKDLFQIKVRGQRVRCLRRNRRVREVLTGKPESLHDAIRRVVYFLDFLFSLNTSLL